MSTVVVEQDWRARAIEAAEQQNAHCAAEAARYADENNRANAAQLRKLLQQVGVEAEPTCGEIDLEGVRFFVGRSTMGYGQKLFASVPCPDERCLNRNVSWDLMSVANLGDFLQGRFQNTCQSRGHFYGEENSGASVISLKIETTEDRLAAAIRELIRDELREAAER